MQSRIHFSVSGFVDETIVLPKVHKDIKKVGPVDDQAILVEESFAGCRAAEAGNTIQAADFALEFVVVCQLLVCDVC